MKTSRKSYFSFVICYIIQYVLTDRIFIFLLLYEVKKGYTWVLFNFELAFYLQIPGTGK